MRKINVYIIRALLYMLRHSVAYQYRGEFDEVMVSFSIVVDDVDAE